MLKREVDNEIRRDRKKNLLQITSHAVNQSQIVKSQSHEEKGKTRKSLPAASDAKHSVAFKKMSTVSTTNALNYTSLRRKDPELILE